MHKEYKSFYHEVKGNKGEKCKYNTRLDTYGCGCAHDCSYCYAKSLLDFRGLWNADKPSMADIEKIKRKISKLEPGSVVRLGGMTDCFQPMESIHKVTYETIKALNERRVHYLIVTKSDLVASDEYINLFDKELAHIQMTVTSTDDDLALQYEKATPTSKRIEAIEKLQEHDFDVFLRLSPFIPEFVDIEAINSVKCDKIIIEFLRVNHWVKKWLPGVDYDVYNVNYGGYKHMSLEKKKEYVKLITGFKEMSMCDSETKAYKYWKHNFNFNKDDCCNLRL